MSVGEKPMVRLISSLIIQLLLVKFDCGYGDIGTKNNTILSPTLCKFFFHCISVVFIIY